MRLFKFLVVLWTFLVIPYSSAVSNISYVGCYGLLLHQESQHHIFLVTLDKCVQYCRAFDATNYAGVEASKDYCFCGDDIAKESLRRNDTLCDVPCPDESLRTCGGDWKMSLYDIRGTYAMVPAIANTSYVGCYNSTFSTDQGFHHPIASVTLEKCVQYCRAINITKYAGVEASDSLCYCGDDIAEKSEQMNDTLCNVPCPNESLRTCGGDRFMSLYDIRGTSAVETIADVDFLVGIFNGVRVYHSADHWTTFDTLTALSPDVGSVDYHLSKNLLFYFTRQMIFKTTMDPKRGTMETAPNGHLTKDPSTCHGFAVDWVHDRIYWADCNSTRTTIKSMGLDGEDEQVVVSRAGSYGQYVTRMEVDPFKGVVFWTANGDIQSCKVSGEGFIANMTTKAHLYVSALALDLQLLRVYYVGELLGSASLYSMDYVGGAVMTHYSLPQFSIVKGLSIVGGKVLWASSAYRRDAIYEAPLNLTRLEDVKMLKVIGKNINHMRIVHPSLQRNPCLNNTCVHGCVVHGLTAPAQCQCPPGQELHPDGVSCHDRESNNDHQITAGVFSFSMKVLAMLLTSLALVYLGSK